MENEPQFRGNSTRVLRKSIKAPGRYGFETRETSSALLEANTPITSTRSAKQKTNAILCRVDSMVPQLERTENNVSEASKLSNIATLELAASKPPKPPETNIETFVSIPSLGTTMQNPTTLHAPFTHCTSQLVTPTEFESAILQVFDDFHSTRPTAEIVMALARVMADGIMPPTQISAGSSPPPESSVSSPLWKYEDDGRRIDPDPRLSFCTSADEAIFASFQNCRIRLDECRDTQQGRLINKIKGGKYNQEVSHSPSWQDQERQWKSNLETCDFNNEYMFKHTIMPMFVGEIGLRLHYSYSTRWVCPLLPKRDAAILDLPDPRPDLTVGFRPAESFQRLISKHGSYEEWVFPETRLATKFLAFPFLFVETTAAPQPDIILASRQVCNDASRALYNMWRVMEDSGIRREFLESVRVFSVIATSERFELRMHYAFPSKKFEELDPSYPLEYRYEVVTNIIGHYKKSSVLDLLYGVFEYAKKTLLSLLGRACDRITFSDQELHGEAKKDVGRNGQTSLATKLGPSSLVPDGVGRKRKIDSCDEYEVNMNPKSVKLNTTNTG